ncbi:MAG TPA: bifunctional precorrin-2 dehydrogenase/sirohydrochlorin ferrochelatase [Terriglobales bacterium]|nr:bifunctional precorrin-2 dehydrogenase/sirohydrochlorin ferrochelatase [Terriglobales bacterium]
MNLFPIFLKLEGREVVVIGGGAIAESKLEGLLSAGARLRLVAPELTPGIAKIIARGRIGWRQGTFEPADLNGAFMVIAATDERSVNEAVFQVAQEKGVLCNAVDDPDHCHFYYPAVVRRGKLQIAISTAGLSPALAQRLRKQLEAQFGEEYGAWLDWLGAVRHNLFASQMNSEERKKILHRVASHTSFETFASCKSHHQVQEGTQ